MTSSGTFTTLTVAECEALLDGAGIGRVAVASEGVMHIIPVNYASENGVVVFRTGPETVLNETSLQSVAFEVDSINEAGRQAWSVVVHGYGREITGAVDERTRHLLDLHVECWSPEGRDRWYEIVPESVTGRVIGGPALRRNSPK